MFSFVPQIIKVMRTKSAQDVSIITLIQLSLGASLWMVYGVYLRNFVIILANSVTLLTLVVILALYYKYGRKKDRICR